MKLRQLAAGVATGYVTKAGQFVATMTLVPFLLRPEILGVDDYGRAFTLIAYAGIGTVVTAGIRLSFLRSISRAVGEDPDGRDRRVGRLVGSGTALLFLLCGALAAAAMVFEEALLDFVQFPDSPEYRDTLRLALAWMTAENALFLLRGPLMARGAISYVNGIAFAEVLLRVGILFWLLPSAASPLTVYLEVHAVFAVLRALAYAAWSLARAPADLRGLSRASASEVWTIVVFSGSITLAEASSFLVLRAPVVLAAGYLGATEAGFIAIVINTIQSYVHQILFTVVQPLAVPIAARFDPRRISASARSFFFDIEGLYCATVIVTIAAVTAIAPDLIRLWLGDGYQPIVLPTQIILAACGVELTYSIRKSLLVGQAHLTEAIWRIGPMALLTTGLVGVAIVAYGEWAPAVYATGAYLVASSVFGVGSVWSKHFSNPTDPPLASSRFIAFALSFGAAVLASLMTSATDWQTDLLVCVAVLVWTLACIAMLVIPVRRIGATVQRLLGSMDRDLFSA